MIKTIQLREIVDRRAEFAACFYMLKILFCLQPHNDCSTIVGRSFFGRYFRYQPAKAMDTDSKGPLILLFFDSIQIKIHRVKNWPVSSVGLPTYGPLMERNQRSQTKNIRLRSLKKFS